MSHHITKILSILVLLAGLTARADTLENLTAEALRNNPELRALEAGIASAKGGVRTAGEFANPELSIAPGVKRIDDPSVRLREFHGNFELSQLFEFPGKRALKIAIAEKNVALRQLALEGFRFALAAKVRRAFYEMLAAQEVTALRSDQVESARTFVTSSKKRAESGYASDFETIKSQAEFISAQKDLLEAQGKVAAAGVTLNMLLGRSPSVPVSVRGSLERAGTEPAAGLEFLSLAMARNPGLRALRIRAEAAGLTLRSTRFGSRPDFAVSPQVEYTRNEQIYGLGVTIALPFWDRKQGEIQTATAEQQRLLAELEMARLEIAGAVTRTTKDLELAHAEFSLYTPAFLERLKSLVAQAEKSYAQSATSLLIYLDAKRTYFDTMASYYEALGNVSEERAELESAVGVPLDFPASTTTR